MSTVGVSRSLLQLWVTDRWKEIAELDFSLPPALPIQLYVPDFTIQQALCRLISVHL